MRCRERRRVGRNCSNRLAMRSGGEAIATGLQWDRRRGHGNRLAMRTEGEKMAEKFVPKGKLSKKARKELNRQKRVTWEFSPVTKKVESKKLYSRKRKTRDREMD